MAERMDDNMLKLKKMLDFETANYEGFTLKKGFYYGRNLRGQAIASSGWQWDNEEGNLMFIYTRTERGWEGEWHPIELYSIEE